MPPSGRTGVYQMQALMRLVNGGGRTRSARSPTPATCWPACRQQLVLRSEDLHHDHKAGDAGIYDLLLHSQDRSYSVGELFDWLRRRPARPRPAPGLHRRAARPFALPAAHGAGRQAAGHAAALRQLPLRQQYEMAELMGGNIITHSLYVTRDAACTAPLWRCGDTCLFSTTSP
jgi:hypothetical protein